VAVLVQLHDTYSFFGPVPLRLNGTNPGPAAAVIHSMGTLHTLRLLARAARGVDPSRLPGVEVWTGFKTLSVEADPAAWVEADGELLGRASLIEMIPAVDGLPIVDTGPLLKKRRFSLR